MTITLRASDFEEFFGQINRDQENRPLRPFPWQMRLAETVCATGAFPPALDLPTGTGKTACIEVALFHLAHDLARGGARRAPLRIAWVVDRRLIVDEAYDRASNIADALKNAREGILFDAAELFRGIAGFGGPPLVVQRLRGGIPREGDWARTPCQPTVVSSTVDQVGSRLLFRGYGVSPRMRPVHAGLLGEDALIMLDEVHLAEPFRQTLEAIEARKHVRQMPWQVVQLSATPRASGLLDQVKKFELSDADKSDQTLEPRLFSAKPARLARIKHKAYGSEHAEYFARAAVEIANSEREDRCILVVVNRVAFARRIFTKVKDLVGSSFPEDALVLLIGRNRDLSKDALRKILLERCKSGIRRRRGEPFIVVATQCIEAGADLDFDALITQVAPLDALRQRFGRLNRMGRAIDPIATIIAAEAEVAPSAKADAVYGDALRPTWEWLESRVAEAGTIDFAPLALNVSDEDAATLRADRLNAPILMPEHVQALTQTLPAPEWSPDPSLYLHGTLHDAADVNIIWRADISEEKNTDGEVGAILALVPPRMAEAISLPIASAKRWLRGERGAEAGLTDIEGSFLSDEEDGATRSERFAWRWSGSDSAVEAIVAKEIRPGDTLVVPSLWGGCDRFGWLPQDAEHDTADDVAEEAAKANQGTTFALRLHPRLLEQAARLERMTSALSWQVIHRILVDNGENAQRIVAELRDVAEDGELRLPSSLRDALTRFSEGNRQAVHYVYVPKGGDRAASGCILTCKVASPSSSAARSYDSPTEDDALGARGEQGESLEEHSENVRALAHSFSERLSLSAALTDDIALAALLHDVGKADLRFQRYLSGSIFGSHAIRAKSGKDRSLRADRRAYIASGLPDKWRHEALSVRIARVHPDFVKAHDPELVLWLIGTHHGYGRPVFPHQEPRDDTALAYYGFVPRRTSADALRVEPEPGPQRVDFSLHVVTESAPMRVDWQTMFRRLEARYGAWGLAWLEGIVRLADHRASEVSALKPAEASG